MRIPQRNAIIRLLLQYPDDEMCATPFLWSTDTNLLSFVLVSQSAGEGPARAPKPLLSPSLSLFFSPSSISLAVFLPLFNSSSSSLLIALLISHWQVRMRRRRGGGRREKSTNFLNPIDLLCKTFLWEFTLAKKKVWRRNVSLFSPLHLPSSSKTPVLLFQLEAIFPASWICAPTTNRTLYKWINALQRRSRLFGALSPLPAVV